MLNQVVTNYEDHAQTNIDYPSLDAYINDNIMSPIKKI